MSLQALKNLDTDKLIELDEPIALLIEAEALIDKYKQLSIDLPDYLTNAVEVLGQTIEARTRAADLAALRDAEADIERNRSRAERVNLAQQKADALRRKLKLPVADPGTPVSN